MAKNKSIVGFEITTKAIAGNAIGAIIFQFLIRFKGIFILPLLVRFLTKDNIGELRVINTSISLFLPVLTLNILDGSGMFFSSDFDKKSVSTKFNSVITFSLILLLISIVPVFLVFKYINFTSNISYLIIANIVCNYLFKISIFLHQAYQKTKKLISINLLVEYGSAFITFVLLYFGNKNIESVIVPTLAINLVISIFLLLEVYSEIDFLPFFIDRLFIRKALKTSIPLIPVFFSEWIISSISIYFLGFYQSKSEIGNFSVALSIATLLLTLKSTLQYFWYSTTSNLLVNKKFKDFDKYYIMIYKSYLLLIILSVFFYLFFVDDLLLLFSNKSFLSIRTPIIIISIGFGLLILSSILNGVLYALAKTKAIMVVYFSSSIIVLVSSFILIPKQGIIGASISSLMGNLCLFIGMQFLVNKYYVLPKIANLNKFTFYTLILFLSGVFFRNCSLETNEIRILGIVYIILIIILAAILKIFPLGEFILRNIRLKKKLWI